MFNTCTGQHAYTELKDDSETIGHTSPSRSRKQRWTQVAIMCVAGILLCSISFVAGLRVAGQGHNRSPLEQTIPSIPITDEVFQQVRTYPDIEIAPPSDGTREPAWDQLIPDGFGYVKHPTLAPETSIVGVFHQLHCLYTVRRAYYAAHALANGQKFNTSGVRDPIHIGHCFDYLQQSLTCQADGNIEPWLRQPYPEVMFGRRCRDYEQIKSWVSKWKVFDGQGFIYDTVLAPQSPARDHQADA